MTQLDFYNIVAELMKQSVDSNPNFSEWEKWWRKVGIEKTKELAKQYYEYQQHLQSGRTNKNGWS